MMAGEDGAMIDYASGVTAIDTQFAGRTGQVASHLLVDSGEAALVDVGSNYSVPHILRALEEKGVAREAVRYVCVTHVHLDHAGGAGELMHNLPQATLVVHPRSARHMIDPSALFAGARSIFGDEVMARDYGEPVPVPEERVRIVDEGDRLPLGARSLLFLDTPGHANHHYSMVDETGNCIFAGDTFGVSYRSLATRSGDFIFPSTSPVHFDPEAAHRSVDRLRDLRPEAIYVAHFGEVTDIPRLAGEMHRGLDAHVDIALRHADAGDGQADAIAADLLQWFVRRLQEHGADLRDAEVENRLALDIQVNTQGLVVWLQRRQRQ